MKTQSTDNISEAFTEIFGLISSITVSAHWRELASEKPEILKSELWMVLYEAIKC